MAGELAALNHDDQMSEALDNWKPSTFQVILFLVGGVLLYLGQDLAIPGAGDVGIGCIGLLIVVVGADIGMRRLGWFRMNGWGNVVESYRGVLELVWAALILFAGIAIMTVPVMGWLVPGGAGDFVNNMLSTSTGIGGVMSVVGLMLSLNGIIRALAGSGTVRPKWLGEFGNAIDRAAGVVMVAAGLAVAAVGLLLLIAPGWVNAAIQQIGSLFSTL